MPNSARHASLVETLRRMIEDSSGLELADADPTATMFELGLDSLFLTQFALELQQKFKVKIAFRQLLDELSSIDALAAHLDKTMPAEAPPAAPAPIAAAMSKTTSA